MTFEKWIENQSRKHKGNYDYWLNSEQVAKDAWDAAFSSLQKVYQYEDDLGFWIEVDKYYFDYQKAHGKTVRVLLMKEMSK